MTTHTILHRLARLYATHPHYQGQPIEVLAVALGVPFRRLRDALLQQHGRLS